MIQKHVTYDEWMSRPEVIDGFERARLLLDAAGITEEDLKMLSTKPKASRKSKQVAKLAATCALAIAFQAHALVSTNSDAITTTPSLVGWDVTSLSGEGAAIAPLIWVTVNHMPERGLDFWDGHHPLIKAIVPPGVDLRFCITSVPFTKWAPVYSPTNEWSTTPVVIIGGGVGTGRVEGGTNFYWGAESSRAKRWGRSSLCQLVTPLGYFLWLTDNCGASNGDSGGAVFTPSGEYVGPVKFGSNPMVLGEQNSGGTIVWQYLDLIKEYLPGAATNTPPKPVAVTKLTVERK